MKNRISENKPIEQIRDHAGGFTNSEDNLEKTAYQKGFAAAIKLCEYEKQKLKTACDESLQLYNEQVKNCKDVSFAYDELKQRERDLVSALEQIAQLNLFDSHHAVARDALKKLRGESET